ncbi:unnamed protein product [Penicillium nalgiovense]|uniref:Major facilitator superfamily (MFS) profile domain-containing protein n=1 Tax=Penicillium nalgiovense TaxID=60175 RepID=A0A9W4I4K6_PENNA|nr:unnamed protein product [Penicillium nalgiovense]CAG7957714.1 unnamed protein product [Penicillium nalgiovense]CAG7959257.1 unnamed protein product [Penicillium nalgiovense]CAG7959870.1 unnamed protein product [Penicillium nalgiovense]CAG7960948.1 unnamed protein product [Penicillium nalgiovense]
MSSVDKNDDLHSEKAAIEQSEVLVNTDLMNDAFDGENREHEMSTWAAIKSHPWACLWAFTMCFTIVMESFDMFLNGNFVALPHFKEVYGVEVPGHGKTIETKWQSSLFQAGQCGAFVGVFLAGPITNKFGYRWTTIFALMLMNATIFVSFFANSLALLVVGQALEGVPWGFFIANSPAYASEIVPLSLRGACTATLQMSWSIGSIIVAGVTYGFNKRSDEWAWRVPLALQWIFPTPLLILLFFAPESPWWLIRRGRKAEALRSIERLGGKSHEEAQQSLAMIERTVEIEAQMGGSPTLLDLLKGTDLRRTIITCLIYASQNFAGNLIANQATYFFEQAGMGPERSFQLNLINSCLQLVANIIALPLASSFGRRTIYLWGTATNVTLLMVLGVCASISQNNATNYAQAVLGILISFVFAGSLGPISYTIIAETSSVRLRALSTGVGRAAYYVAEIPMIYLASQMLNPGGWNLAGKCGYVWGGTACVCFVSAYWFLPELKGRSYRESDILFNRRISARKFKSTVIDVRDNEHSRRRNGTLASCEPCRKGKVRCDHAQPVCERCQKRGYTSNRCFYHPAPLTSIRRRPDRHSQIHLSPSTSLRNLGNPMSDSETLDAVAECPSVIQPALRTEQLLPEGYLGPTSFIAGLEENVDLFHGEQFNTGGSENSTIAPSPGLVKRTAEVLRCLQDFSAIKNLVQKYYGVSQTAVIPSSLILNALDELEVTVNASLFGPASDEQLFTFSTFVIHNTSEALKIPQNSDGTVFHKCFTGPSLRLEIIGIICALAGRASYFGLADSAVHDTESRTQFSHKMLVACDLTIQICKSLTGLNDLSLWLVHEDLLLSKLLRGDSSSVTWNRLGELATDIFELGAHRDTPSLLPFFILESRRRLFAASYQLDKSIATFLGRPPRISWRHSDCRLPLDISDVDLAGHTHILEAARRSLDSNGWNTKKVYHQASWIRLRFTISTFREEILELSLQKPSLNRTEQLRRCHEAWNLLPEHLQYTSSCWESDLPIGVKLISIISYLAYLYNEFSIQSLLYQDSKKSNAALLDVSSEILSTVLSLGRQWERSVDIKGDFTWIALVYGFSCAGVLIRAIQEQARTGQPLLYSGSRSSLIRNLSVFISQLESMAGPEQATSPLFIRATSVFSSIIDEILEPRPEVPVDGTNPDAILDSDIDTFFFDLLGMDSFETQDFRVAFDDMLY